MRRHGFTVLETLIAFTVFAMLITLVVNFMTSTNVEVGTVTSQSIANERCSVILNYLTTDIRAAKRGTIEFPDKNPITALTFLKYIDNKDDKAADKVVVQKITYRFDAAAHKITRYATPVNYKDDGTFEKGGDTEEYSFDNFSAFEVSPGSTDGTREHVNLVGFKVSTAVDLKTVGHAQVSTAQTIAYVRDENYYAKQPKWNENALYTSSLVSVTRGKMNLPDFSEFTAAANWVADVGKKFPEMVNDVGQQVFEGARQKLAERIFQESDKLKNEFLSSSTVSGVVSRAKNEMVGKLFKEFGEKREFAAAAMLLKNTVYDSGLGPAIRDKILGKKLTNADLAALVGDQLGSGPFGIAPYGLPKVTRDELAALALVDQGKSPPFGLDLNGARQRADQFKAMVYQAAGTEKDFNNFCSGFAQVMTDAVTDRIRDRARAVVTDDLVSKTVDDLSDLAKTNLKENLGFDAALATPDLNPKVRSEVDRMLGSLDGTLSQGGGKIKDLIKKEIVTGKGQNLPNLADPARDSLNAAKDQNQSGARDMDATKVADAMSKIPDPVNSAITSVADQILSGRSYDEKAKDFVDDPKSVNYMDKIWTDFGLKPPHSTGI